MELLRAVPISRAHRMCDHPGNNILTMKKPLLLVSALAAAGIGVTAQEIGRNSQGGTDLPSILRAGIEAFGGNREQDSISLNQVTQNWNAEARAAAKAMFEKYGAPNEITAKRLVWHDNGPWRRTQVVNEEVPHNFPDKHNDVLEQTLAIDIPVDRFADIAQFSGSVTADRTRGELSARCDREEHNFIALNLANDIVSGRLSVEEARARNAELTRALKQGQRPAYASGIQFSLPVSTRTGDADHQYSESSWQYRQQQQQQQQRSRRIGW
jgi:hypothetical protein